MTSTAATNVRFFIFLKCIRVALLTVILQPIQSETKRKLLKIVSNAIHKNIIQT